MNAGLCLGGPKDGQMLALAEREFTCYQAIGLPLRREYIDNPGYDAVSTQTTQITYFYIRVSAMFGVWVDREQLKRRDPILSEVDFVWEQVIKGYGRHVEHLR